MANFFVFPQFQDPVTLLMSIWITFILLMIPAAGLVVLLAILKKSQNKTKKSQPTIKLSRKEQNIFVQKRKRMGLLIVGAVALVTFTLGYVYNWYFQECLLVIVFAVGIIALVWGYSQMPIPRWILIGQILATVSIVVVLDNYQRIEITDLGIQSYGFNLKDGFTKNEFVVDSTTEMIIFCKRVERHGSFRSIEPIRRCGSYLISDSQSQFYTGDTLNNHQIDRVNKTIINKFNMACDSSYLIENNSFFFEVNCR